MSCPVINFSWNHNGKLYCRFFTTLRLHNPNKYQVGHWYYIQLKGQDLGPGIIRDIKHYTLHQITAHIAALDMGLNLESGKKLLLGMYKNKKLNWQTQKFDFILIEQPDKMILPIPNDLFGVYEEDQPQPIEPKQTDLFNYHEKVA